MTKNQKRTPYPSTLSTWLVIAIFATCGCGNNDEVLPTTSDTSGSGGQSAEETPIAEGWSEQSHGNSADPNYDVVFAQDKVQRLDIVIGADDFALMQADVDDFVAEQESGPSGGGPPEGGPPGGGPPPNEAIVACEGKQQGDSCEYQYQGATVSGACMPDPHQDRLICVENAGGPGGTDRDPIYVPATLQYEGKTWPYVGIRYKGNSSLRFSWSKGIRKLPFRLELDEYEDQYPATKNQRFYGFKELTFAPGYYDPSYLHDALASEIFDDLGVPAARTAFWAVYVDMGDGAGPTYWGLYTMIEDPTDAMMDRVYGDDSGNMYKPERGCADWSCFDEEAFVKKNNEEQADYSDVQGAIDAVLADRSDAASWRANLEQTIDVSGFIRWLAVSTVIVNWDSYGMAPHNYYLYSVPNDSGRLVWIPWDHNMSLAYYPKGALSLRLDEVAENWPLIRYIIDDPVYGAEYRQQLAATLQGPLEATQFEARALALHELIAPYVQQEQAPYTQLESYADFEQSLSGNDGLYEHVADRLDEVQTLLAD